MKILLIRLSAIGDIVHLMVLLPLIKQAIPQAQISWLVDEQFADILQLTPELTNTVILPFKRWKQHKSTLLSNLLKFKQQCKMQQFDYIIDTHGLLKSAILARLLFNTDITGLNYQSVREFGANFFYQYTVSVNNNAVAVERFWSLISQALKITSVHYIKTHLNITIPADSQISYKELADQFVLLLHGTAQVRKQWSLASWQELITWLLLNSSLQIVLGYSNNTEYQFVMQLYQLHQNKRVVILPKMSLLNFAYIVSLASYVIGMDTGFMHLANLLGKHTIGVYISTCPIYGGMAPTHTGVYVQTVEGAITALKRIGV
jgi:heptosyltransferase I